MYCPMVKFSHHLYNNIKILYIIPCILPDVNYLLNEENYFSSNPTNAKKTRIGGV